VSAPSAKDKILDIECLRAFAIIYTLIAHFRVLYVVEPRWVQEMDKRAMFHGGVDLFFVISGFVISKNLIPAARSMSDLSEKVRFVSQFWVRRVYRLWPSSWLWAFIGLGVVIGTGQGHLKTEIYDIAAALLQIYNYHAYSCANGAGICSHQAVGVYWSLSLEEQFYIVLPVLLVAARNQAKWILGVALLLSVPAHLFLPALGGFFRWEAFCVGVLLAWLYGNEAVRSSVEQHLFKPLGRATWIASYLMLAAIPMAGVGALGGAGYTITAMCAGVLVACASLDQGYLGMPLFLKPVLVWFGARSYSIYLVHTAVFLGFKALALKGWRDELPPALADVGWVGGALVVVLIFSELNFRFVESRFRHMGRPAPALLATT
jgi:peptidoglycan/LPS O-acetylase OafA/YrhL